MAENKSGIQVAGDVEITGVWLYDTKNNNLGHNLFNIFTDIRIFESIHTAKMNGYIVLNENQNLISSIPIVGHELLKMEFKTPGMKAFTVNFVVTGIGMKEHKDKMLAYAINFISVKTYKALNNRISKAYYGNPSDIAKDVYKKAFDQDLLDVDKSDNNIKFVSPFWDPLTILDHVSDFAMLPNQKITTPNYLFYETHTGHKFKSLSTLFRQAPTTVFVFNKNPARLHLDDGSSTRNITMEYANIIDLEFIDAPCIIKRTLTGAENSKVFSMNLLSKEVDISAYTASVDFNKTVHTDERPITNLVMANNAGLYATRPIFPQLFDGVSDYSADIQSKRVAMLSQLETFKLNITVHGRTDIEVGQMIFLILGNFKTVDNLSATTEGYDPIYSGKYLITKISHAFTMAKHQMTMEIVKDSAMRGAI